VTLQTHPPALLGLALLAACGEPVRVEGRTLAEHLAALDAAPPLTRGPLVRGLGRFGAAGAAAVGRLEALLRSDPALRDDAALALGEIGTEAAERALAAALADPEVDLDAVGPAAVALCRSAPPERSAGAIRELAHTAPARAARLCQSDPVFDAVLADPGLRGAVLASLAGRLDDLDRRGADAVLRRLAALGRGATGQEDVLARALDRGIATEACLDTLVAIGSPAALTVVAERARPPWRADAAALLDAAARLAPAADQAEVGLAILDRAEAAGDPELRGARLRALGALGGRSPELGAAIRAALSRALLDPKPRVAAEAGATWTALCREAGYDPALLAEAFAAAARAAPDSGRARNLIAALGAADLPEAVLVPALADLARGEDPERSAAAERALQRFAGPAARAARRAALLRPGAPEAARRLAAWTREPATRGAEIAAALDTAARDAAAEDLLPILFAALDDRPAAEQIEALAPIWTAVEATGRARADAFRRLRALAPERARLRLAHGGQPFEALVLADRPGRATPAAAVPTDLGAVYALAAAGALRVDGAGLGAARNLLLLDAGFLPTEVARLEPGATLARDGVGGAVLLPPGVPGEGPLIGLDPDLIRALVR
jgi:hypothetical protein